MADPKVLRDFIEESGLKPYQNSVSWVFTCPRCSKPKKLYIRKSDGRFVCWYCRTIDGFEGRVEYALSEILGIPVGAIKAKLYSGQVDIGEVHLDYDLKEWCDDEEELEEPLRTLQWPLDYYPIDHKNSVRGLKYLEEERKIPLAIAKEYGIRYAPTKKRVVFPVMSGDKVYGWQERLVVPNRWWNEEECVWKETLKAISSEKIPRDRMVMFADRLRGSDHAIVTEGPVDAIKAHLCGGNVCTMGKAISTQQMGLIRNSGVQKVYLALDPDAYAEFDRLCVEFSDLEVYLMDPAPYKDLGEMSMESVLELYKTAPRIHSSARLFGSLR